MKSMIKVTAFAALLIGGGFSPAAADGDFPGFPGFPGLPGVCTLNAAELIGANWGYASQGTALQGNPLGLTPGPFSQAGVASGITAIQNGSTITGTWSTTFTIIDGRGVPSTATQPGAFTVNTKTCTGDFYWNVTGSQIIFRAVFVNGSLGFRSISMVPGVVIAFPTGTKL